MTLTANLVPSNPAAEPAPSRTALYEWHVSHGGKMVPFAGYAMPLHYRRGIMQEHLHTRSACGLFDVSHMGQIRVRGKGVAAALEKLVCGDLLALAPGNLRYSLLLNEQAGILDDLILGPLTSVDDFWLVVNAGKKKEDFKHLSNHLNNVSVEMLEAHGLLALQGPGAAQILASIIPGVEKLPFMGIQFFGDKLVSRTGYTGEDGFEISLPNHAIVSFAEKLLATEGVAPVGLGARDSLRLEAGLCLYGHDLDQAVTPVEAGLSWTISKRRRAEGGYPGAARVAEQLSAGPPRRRVGLKPQGRAPVREGAILKNAAGQPAGQVTSGGFSPSLNAPIAMGYVETALSAPGTLLTAELRGRDELMTVVSLPFLPHQYHRG